MSNNIHGQDQVQEITKLWSNLEEVVTRNVDILKKYSQNASNLPSQYIKQVEETKKAQEALNKALEEAKSTQEAYTNQLKAEERQAKKTAKVRADLAVSTSKEAKEFHKLNEQKKAINKQNREEARALIRAQGLYNQVQQRVNKLTKEYNDLAAKKALGRTLSAKEEASLASLTDRLNKYQDVLKKVDADVGKYGRNVGNYASGWNGLGNSINQLTREMPAFANSMQTGFMAISNNLPMLFDEISRTKKEIASLRAEGKQTQGLLTRLGASIFSLGTVLSIGVTLLTLYGDEIVEWVSNLFDAEKKVNALKVETEALNEAYKDTQFTKAIQEVFELKSVLEQAKKGVISKKDAVDQYNEVLGDNLGYVNSVEEAEDNIVKKAPAYIKATLLKAAANHIASKSAEELAKLYEKEAEAEDALDKHQERTEKATGREKRAAKESLKRREFAVKNIQEERETIVSEYQQMYLKMQNEIEKLQKQFDFNLDPGDDSSTRTKLSPLEFKSASELNKEFQDYAKKVMKVLSDNFKVEIGKIDPIKLPPIETDEFKETLTKLNVLTDEFINNLQYKALDQSGFSSIKTFFDGTFEDLKLGANTTAEEFAITFNAIGEVVKDTFSVISQLGQQNFEQELYRLEQQKEVALQFAGEGTAARERLEEQYDERRKQIQNRQAKAQKEQAMFMAGITTAQSALAAYASQLIPGDPTSIVRAKIAAAITAAFGLVQIGLIASQKVPQFWAGGETEGGQIIVNDDPLGIKGSNYKEVIVEPSGKVHKPQGKNVKMNVPKGSYVYPTYTDFNKELQDMLNINDVVPFRESMMYNDLPSIQVNNIGVTAKEMDRVMTKHFSNIKTNNILFDKKGISTYMSKGHSKTVSLNNRVEFKGFNV